MCRRSMSYFLTSRFAKFVGFIRPERGGIDIFVLVGEIYDGRGGYELRFVGHEMPQPGR